MIDELAELVEMYDQGAWSRGDFLYQVALLVHEASVQGDCRSANAHPPRGVRELA